MKIESTPTPQTKSPRSFPATSCISWGPVKPPFLKIWLEVQLPQTERGGGIPHYDILLPVYLFISRVTYFWIHTKMSSPVHKASLFLPAFPPLTFIFLSFSTDYHMNWNILVVGLNACFHETDSLIQSFLFSICSPVLLSCRPRKWYQISFYLLKQTHHSV